MCRVTLRVMGVGGRLIRCVDLFWAFVGKLLMRIR